ncbi:MAG: hypothetical protein R2715_19650 [Ilumatobacteraceae bacterium]
MEPVSLEEFSGAAGLDPTNVKRWSAPSNRSPSSPPPGRARPRCSCGRIARRVASGDADERHVVALAAFSRQAAAGLNRRLFRLGVRDATIGTFHSVAFGLLRQRWADLGVRGARCW